jgi:hypothetical protein
MTAQCAYCYAVTDALDAYRICPTCRAKATSRTTAGRIHRAHLRRHDARVDGAGAEAVLAFGALPSDWAGWVE